MSFKIEIEIKADINIRLKLDEEEKENKIERIVLKFGNPVEKDKTPMVITKSEALLPPPAAVMTVDQQLSATIIPEDADGNAVPIPDGDAVVWTSSDTSVVVVTAAVDGLSAVCAGQGKVGSSTITAVVNDATGVALATAVGGIQCTPAGISQVAMSFGTPSAKP